MKRGLILTILIAVLVFGAFLRLDHINDESLWLDEGITYYNSSGESFTEIWDKTAKLDQSPPFYYFITHGYLEIFGENEFGFRFISVIFGVLSILFLYLLMANMFNRETGVFAAYLLAINPFHIGFSIESRMYMLLTLEAIMAFYFLYKALTHESRGYGWWFGFTVTSILGLYTHNFFFFVLAAFAFVFLVLWINSKKKTGKLLMGILSSLVLIISYIPWFPNFLKQLQVDRYWMAPNSWADLKNYFLDFANDSSYILLAIIFLIVVGIIWSFSRIRSLEYKKGIFASLSLIVFIFVGIGLPFTYSIIFEPILKIRYVVYLLPIFISLTAIGLYALRRFHIIFPIFILIAATYLFSPWQASAYPAEFGEDYRKLDVIVSKDPDPVIVHTPSIAHVINFYNKGLYEIYPFPYSDDLTEYNIDKNHRSKFIDLLRDFISFYLVISHTHENPPGLLYIWSDSVCDESYEIDVKGMQVYHFSACR
ncbi:hypothetical protein GF366_04265 [Candidatus Peregrinibacteria bacterium]|nr:hypothetical protein [Candidatus Peregrinibacteria bacterium]